MSSVRAVCISCGWFFSSFLHRVVNIMEGDGGRVCVGERCGDGWHASE